MTKKQPPRESPKERKQTTHKSHKLPHKNTAPDWKFWAGMVVAIVSLLLAVFGTWLTIEDRPTISTGPPLDPHNLFSTQITIVNNGVFPLRNVSFAVFLKSAEINGAKTTNNRLADYEPPTKILRPGEPVKTDLSAVVGHNSHLFHVEGKETEDVRYGPLDIGLFAEFRPAWAPFWKRTQVFRFRTFPTIGGMTLEQVPAEDIENDYKRAVEIFNKSRN
jgi:hypothetical protein